jgi:hypothetical protein
MLQRAVGCFNKPQYCRLAKHRTIYVGERQAMASFSIFGRSGAKLRRCTCVKPWSDCDCGSQFLDDSRRKYSYRRRVSGLQQALVGRLCVAINNCSCYGLADNEELSRAASCAACFRELGIAAQRILISYEVTVLSLTATASTAITRISNKFQVPTEV